MPTQLYKNQAGERVPSVTTVIANLGWNKDALMKWAHTQGKEGLEFRDTSKKAADIGTVAHALVEAHIIGDEIDPFEKFPGLTKEQYEMSQVAYNAYLSWREITTLKLIKAELPLVSEKYQYGGTIDTIALSPEMERKNCSSQVHDIVDWKTSNGTYADHLIQVAAYAKLYQEVEQIKVANVHLCRFGKDAPSFLHHCWPVEALEPAWIVFTNLRSVHHYRWIIERLK